MISRVLCCFFVLALILGCSPAAPGPSFSGANAVSPGTSTPAPTSTGGAPPGAPTPTPNPNGWRLLTEFPVNGAAQVNSIVFVNGRFVAGGTASNGDAACESTANQGRVWTSPDGAAWTSQPDSTFADTDLTLVFAFGNALFAVGTTGAFGEASPCPSAAPGTGTNIWRSADSGATWQELPQPAALVRATVSDVVASGGKLLAVGSLTDTDGNEHAATWTSTDAATWIPSELAPTAPHVATAAIGSVYVAFGDDQDSPLPWVSRDAGAHWYEESVDVPGVNVPQLQLSIDDVMATDTGFLAVGNACCIGTPQLVPVSYATPDGTQWHGTVVGGTQTQAMKLIRRLPNGYLAAGIQTYVDPAADKSTIGGRSWVSTDGKTWLAGPNFAELSDGNVTALAVGSGGAVVAGATFLNDPAATTDTGLRVWFAPLSAFGQAASH